MDPQQRLLLEVVGAALSDAGLETRGYAKRKTGVFVGASVSEYKEVMATRLRAQQLAGGEFGSVAAGAAETGARVLPMRAFSIAGGLLNMMAATVAQTF